MSSNPPTKPTQYSTADMLAVIREQGTAGTADVADAVGCSHDTAYKRLRALEESGEIDGRKIGQAWVWSLADE